MLVLFKKVLSLLNPADNSNLVGNQLKKPSGLFASKVAKGMNVCNKNLYDLVSSNFILRDNDKVLEVGFGNGFFFEQLHQKNRNAKLFGVEISKEMVRQCLKLNRNLVAIMQLEIKHISNEIMPYYDEMFDTILAINLIYFWENPIENIKELKRVLKNNGQLIIGVRPFHILSHLPFAKGIFNIQEDNWWIELIENNGFKLITNQSITDTPLQFDGKTYEMGGTCWVFKRI